MRAPLEEWALSAEEGARTTLFVATAPQLNGISGRFYREMHEAPTSVASKDREAWQLLWNSSENLTGLPVSSASGPP
jgi:hypothetical protein